ncbi:hypothetical protein [Methanobrevibacter sp.]|uniref:hypothetical protein n=1 Tax=Methanobrevibacter sp. TaxID=66852 RepID=UPI0026DF9541|nr:hypothetical protein [Methanobrevibacter sp.]MDO5859629.1 hypothetical protein [Methanobrevibacter sp.]
MIKKEYLVILMLIIIIASLSIAIFNQIDSNNEIAANDSANHEVLANDSDLGSVEVIRNIGNVNGESIAYVVGVHPLENLTHKTLLKLLPEMTNLNYCYDIYVINVTQDIGYYGDGSSDDSPGRQNGQNLAYKYVYPEISKGNYKLAIDVHSNVGAYDYRTFVFSPLKEGSGNEYAQQVAMNSPNISFYAPDSTTSGPYLTIPLNENGIPAFYFEEYSFAPQNEKDEHMIELINAVDNLKYS